MFPSHDPETKEKKKGSNSKKYSVKELLGTKEFKDAVADQVKVENKTLKVKEEKQMDAISLSVKEMKESLDKGDMFNYKNAASNYVNENKEVLAKLHTTGIPLQSRMQVKCHGNKLKIVGSLQTKDTLDTTTNTSTYTQNIVEFADVYLPTIIDTFNNQTNLFGALSKRDNLEGSNKYGWRIKTVQQSTLSDRDWETSANSTIF